MIYSFLDKKINEELNLVADVSIERKEPSNYFVFEFNDNDGLLRVTEITDNYNEYHFKVKDGDYDFDYQDNKKNSWLVSSR